jgi:putative two-component system response regulator
VILSPERKPTILCVDDTPVNLFLLVELLKGTYRVKTATNGAHALQIVAANPPDLILLDVMMPDMDGYEVCRRLKGEEITGKIPVLFLTAKTQPEEEAFGLNLGAADYIHKPISPPILLARVHHHLAIKQYNDFLSGRNQWLEEEVARRISQLSRMQDATMHVITTLAEFRDCETGNHIRRTQEYMRLIAEKMQDMPEYAGYLTPERTGQIIKSAPLHDVGKIAIPDTILLKPGKLTQEEFTIMKTHTTRGHGILAQAIKNLQETGGFLEVAQQVSRSHQEKWDGSGYPDGLSQAEIPLPARMMAVVDVYDAIRSARPYKVAQSHDQAVSILHESRNHHFDPKIVDVFLSCDAEVQSIRYQWDDLKEELA